MATTTRLRVLKTRRFYLVIALIIAGLLGWMYLTYRTAYVTIHVTYKEKTLDDYFIYGKKEVFINHDVLLRFKWDSSDVYRDIIPKRVYRCKVQGVRFALFSWYRNILHCRPTGEVSSGTRK